ncbi:PEP-CTERM sorting domain-containing protein [Massilia pseudoviolaceinigra]|uniref:PEP-CTERM sorting domain-containing protein n=1 Tax=Massilia pseudoviolaceinigra TaxID=3057165 RepID=UPI00279672B2|nr:PEP-CTERM sorting domain-containing protein [Massilia sp. CCM 9206]MDQ1920970.1 PEP-CTERM sorting domain-containing protein [Massilia sp. CCM 9206]
MSSSVRYLAASAIAFAALLAPQLAFADGVHIESSSVMFDTSWSQRAETLVSDVNGAATFSLVNAVDRLRFPNQFNYFNDYGGVFQLSARAGYKVTGYSLSGGFSGDIYVGQSPDGTGRPGGANTSAGAMSGAHDAVTGETLAQHSWSASDLRGNGDFTFHSGALDRTASFLVSFEGYAYGQASPAIWNSTDPRDPRNYYDFSRAEVGLRDRLLLTVYTQAVPEPHTYAMTLAGLAFLAGVVRRRKRAARAA